MGVCVCEGRERERERGGEGKGRGKESQSVREAVRRKGKGKAYMFAKLIIVGVLHLWEAIGGQRRAQTNEKLRTGEKRYLVAQRLS